MGAGSGREGILVRGESGVGGGFGVEEGKREMGEGVRGSQGEGVKCGLEVHRRGEGWVGFGGEWKRGAVEAGME